MALNIMVVQFKVEINAAPALQALDTLVKGVPQAMGRTLERAAQEVVDGAQSIVPVDTGALRASIKVTESGKNHIVISAGDNDRVVYAAFVEMGTSKMSAQPYMGPQADKMNARLSQIFSEELNKLF